MEETHGIAQGMGKRSGASKTSSDTAPSLNLHMFTYPDVLWTLSFWGFMELDWLNNWPLVTKLNLLHLLAPQKLDSGTESSSPAITIMWLFSWKPAPILRCFLKVTLLT